MRAQSHRPVITPREAERLAKGLRFFSSASKALASSFDYANTLKRVAELTIPAFAAGIAVEFDELGTAVTAYTSGYEAQPSHREDVSFVARGNAVGALCIATEARRARAR